MLIHVKNLLSSFLKFSASLNFYTIADLMLIDLDESRSNFRESHECCHEFFFGLKVSGAVLMKMLNDAVDCENIDLFMLGEKLVDLIHKFDHHLFLTIERLLVKSTLDLFFFLVEQFFLQFYTFFNCWILRKFLWTFLWAWQILIIDVW